MTNVTRLFWIASLCAILSVIGQRIPCFAEPPSSTASQLTTAQEAELREQLRKLDDRLADLEKRGAAYRPWADVAVCSKGVAWALRHKAFPKPDSFDHARRTLQLGFERAAELKAGKSSWETTIGRTVRGYRSSVDESIQPNALTLPPQFDVKSQRRWPLHIVLHGRDDGLSEIKFIQQHEGRATSKEADWIQLDVYGRCCNAYRWAGETDVFEALKDVQGRYRIDERRIVLHGFSMGGAGAWHIGLHSPSRWCSIGPGAGFIDFYKYQNVTQPLPPYQDATLHIYDAADYVQNAFDVPICTYGGELDKQLVASTFMKSDADKLGVPMTLIVGPGVGHKFHPDSLRQFMEFHREKQRAGRTATLDTREIRFVTRTVKYNACDWLAIEEQTVPYDQSSVTAKIDEQGKVARITTRNVGVLRLAREVAATAEIDGTRLPLADAAERLLPDVYYESTGDSWTPLGYTASLDFPGNRDRRKRKNLQGPIDDAFTQPFVCVLGSGSPWSKSHSEWSKWTQQRFSQEFDRWMHGQVQIVTDKEVTPEMLQSKNLILFGDPGSNSILSKIARQLPFKWDSTSVTVAGTTYDSTTHGVACIYPNPMNPRRYVVINSGHTFHAEDFRKSNAWLFPRLGDIAVLKFSRQPDGTFQESTVWAEIFNSAWRLNEPAMSRPKSKATEPSK